jgi:hypothetical protein
MIPYSWKVFAANERAVEVVMLVEGLNQPAVCRVQG